MFNHLIKQSRLLGSVTVISVILFFFIFCTYFGKLAAMESPSAGPAFLFPSQDLEMSEAWMSQAVNDTTLSDSYDLVITLDQHLYPALTPIIQSYAEKNGIRIHVSDGTCGISNGKLYKKTADLAGFCCPPGLADRLPGLQYHTLGIAAIGIMVNYANKVDNLRLHEVRNIFAGKIHRWNELEAFANLQIKDLPVVPTARLHCKQRPGHWRLLLDKEEFFSADAYLVSTIEDMFGHVASNPRAIGFEVLWNHKRFSDKNIRFIKIDGISPFDDQALLSQKYPFYRVYNISTWSGKNKKEHVDKLVDHIKSAMDILDKEYKIVPVSKLKKSGWIFAADELVGIPR